MAKFRKFSWLSIVLAVAGIAGTTTAYASFVGPKTVSVVEVQDGLLLIQLSNGVNYYAKTNAAGDGTGCSTYNRTADGLRAWTSVAEAALMSGKSLNVYFDVCGSTNEITAVDLLP